MSARAERKSISQRRHSAQSLASLHIPLLDDSEPVRPVVRETENPKAMEEDQVRTVEEGQDLFKVFLLEEIENESSVDTDNVAAEVLDEPLLRTTQRQKDPIFTNSGWKLRQMADEFARTRHRQEVRQRADQVDANINEDQFRDLLSELFLGGVTPERIIVLFFYCSDVAKNVLRTGLNIFQRFVDWSLRFIAEYVCQWVHRNGGWRQVLMSQFNVYKLCFVVVATFSAATFLTIKYFK